ncbi:polysaccharide biosynthesis C-terminal domain-containing protein, partial [Neobacillus niacini]
AINIAGHFKETKNRSMFEAIINLVCSLLLVNILGIYGVLIGTILALLYRSADMIFYSSKYILYRKSWVTFRRWLINIGLFLVLIFISETLKINPTSYLEIFLFAVLLCAIIIPVYFIICSLFEREVCTYSFGYLRSFLKKLPNQANKSSSYAK